MRHVELDRRVLGLQPVNNYVHVKTADLYRPNARLTPERQGYQVLTPFGKLGYSLIVSARALSYASPRLPTDSAMPASASRSV